MPERLKLQFQITLNDWLEFRGKEPDSSDRKAEEEWERQLANVEYALLIPKRSFTSAEQLDEFLDIAYQKTVVEKSGEVA